jgi:hypothetical protein
MQVRTIEEGRTSRVFLFLSVLTYIGILGYAIAGSVRDGTWTYKIVILQSGIGCLLAYAPFILAKRLGWLIPTPFYITYLSFLWSAIFLGEALNFYYRFPLFDDLLHLVSSMMACALGFSLFDILSKPQKRDARPLIEALFALFFAVFMGVMWELYEFSFDGILGLNMQKFATVAEGGRTLRELSGRSALTDTMTDLFTDTLGGILISAAGYVSARRKNKLLRSFKISVKDASTKSDR